MVDLLNAKDRQGSKNDEVIMKKIWWAIRRVLRKIVYGTAGGLDDPMIPQLGWGGFVSVYLRRKCFELVNKNTGSEAPIGRIRLVPYQPNHGVMVEYYDGEGNMQWRIHCSYDDFYRMGANLGEKGR